MRSHLRTILVLALAFGLLGVFLYNVDVRGVVGEIVRARPEWLVLSLLTMFANLAIRAWRWQYLLEPLGTTSFGNAFRATAVGFAASSILPARAGEVIRPYFLARHERMSATGAFATIILERLLDMIAVLILLASYVFIFGRDLEAANALAFAAVKWAGATAAAGALAALAVLFFLAKDPARLGQTLTRLGQVLPSRFAGLLGRIAEKFATGLGAIRQPGRLLIALVWSFPLWLCIGLGIWAVAIAFRLASPLHRIVSADCAAGDRSGGAHARRSRRFPRNVPLRRHDVFRRRQYTRSRRGDRAARHLDRAGAPARTLLRCSRGTEHHRDAPARRPAGAGPVGLSL